MAQQNGVVAAMIVAASLFTPAVLAADEKPGDAYQLLHKQMLTAKNYKDLCLVRTKHSISLDKPVPPAEEKMMFEMMMMMMMPKAVKVVSEEVKGDEATLKATIVADKPADPKVKEVSSGTIVMLKEDGHWKIDSEKWNTKIESTKDF